MILTEKEAKRKWCCAAFPSYDANKTQSPSCCEASDCMAWRWIFGPNGNRQLKRSEAVSECLDCKGKGVIPDDTGTEDVTCPECDGMGNLRYWEPTGFCGLAGRPEDY